jgi:23S rRNA (uridine2552-2'-O)-methyltransferase
MPKKSSSRRWLREHFNDPYVKQAHQSGLRSRAVFKLKQLDDRDRLFKPGMSVIDLGAAPGGWSQYVAERVGKKGRVIALDILPMEHISGVEFVQFDFHDEEAMETLLERLNEQKVDWVISDIAPNLSGIESVDLPRTIALAELALDLALKVLNAEGGFLTKVFQGEGFDAFLAQIRLHFKKIVIRKPDASRGRSREVYILARRMR